MPAFDTTPTHTLNKEKDLTCLVFGGDVVIERQVVHESLKFVYEEIR